MSSKDIWLYIFCYTIPPREVRTGRTMDLSGSAQPLRGRRNKRLSEEQKTNFFPPFCLQSLAAAQSEPVGISTFLPNREQGFRVMNWATATDQLTPRSPFLSPFHCPPGKRSLAPPLSQRSLRQEAGFGQGRIKKGTFAYERQKSCDNCRQQDVQNQRLKKVNGPSLNVDLHLEGTSSPPTSRTQQSDA